jgi:hypothetical protein
MSELVQIIPLGIERDRVIYLLKKFPPHKVYFIRNSKPAPEHKEMEATVDKLEKEFESLVPLAEKKHLEIDYTSFKEDFLKFLELMKKEKDVGNDVFVNISAPSRIVSFAAWLAASLTDCRVFYMQAKIYGLKGELADRGVANVMELLHFPILLPDKTEREVLSYLIKKGTTAVKLRDLVKEIGLKKLEIKSEQSGIVKMSYCLRSLEGKGYIKIETVSRKKQKITMTEAGDIIANATRILNI